MEIKTPAAVLDVVCLCAAWCNNCDAYRPLFESLRERFGGATRFSWIDIEDESETLGDIDIENFPTLFLLQGGTPLFLGPLTPQLGVLTQLIETALDERLAPLADSAALALAARMQPRLMSDLQ